MATREFEHYTGCDHNDPDNCSGCALTDTRQESPNYSAWPLAYMENRRPIPAKWRGAFCDELTRSDNLPYVRNLKAHICEYGARFTDNHPWHWNQRSLVIDDIVSELEQIKSLPIKDRVAAIK